MEWLILVLYRTLEELWKSDDNESYHTDKLD